MGRALSSFLLLLWLDELTAPTSPAVVETHPESIVDLRLSHPFPALVEHANSYDYSSMDTEQHGHVPAVIVLIKALEEWKASVRRLPSSPSSNSRR